mmetsp:Transcript_9817/g.19295  ORF Transcript_9817/g.19295 Transcript_9817/m.19295 type:complete len:272 (+) Transcript_9817:331-1146(+)
MAQTQKYSSCGDLCNSVCAINIVTSLNETPRIKLVLLLNTRGLNCCPSINLAVLQRKRDNNRFAARGEVLNRSQSPRVKVLQVRLNIRDGLLRVRRNLKVLAHIDLAEAFLHPLYKRGPHILLKVQKSSLSLLRITRKEHSVSAEKAKQLLDNDRTAGLRGIDRSAGHGHERHSSGLDLSLLKVPLVSDAMGKGLCGELKNVTVRGTKTTAVELHVVFGGILRVNRSHCLLVETLATAVGSGGRACSIRSRAGKSLRKGRNRRKPQRRRKK